MTTNAAIAVLLLASSTVTAVPARESIVAASARSARELARTLPVMPSRDGQDAWRRVQQLDDGSEVRVILADGSSKDGRLERVTEDGIVVASGGGLPPVEFRRDAITRIQRPTKGSVLGGVIGAAAGALAGVAASVNLAMKQCGESCNDEKALIGLSLIGMPIAGGYAGAKLMPRPRWTNVYERR